MRTAVVLSFAACAALLWDVRPAHACGCLSPPAVAEGEYAVNQRAEQIIFEVEPGWVTAHVLIKYAGDPAKFAWIIPVPEAPELAISPLTAFGLLDRDTAPQIFVADENICPISEYQCAFPDVGSCGGFSSGDDSPGGLADAGASDSPGGGTPPVDVIDTKVVGDYQTVTFRASEAAAATQWLRDNGFIVNATTAIYMESYVNANMVFVAAKLVPGAGARSIKPLRLRYRAPFPQIPLVLTAVAAEPHLTVTSFIYANQPFKPQGHPIVQISPDRIAHDATGRTNYPMALARAVDEAGGDGFVIEHRGLPTRPEFGGMSAFCCDGQNDSCNVGGDNQCQCPRAEFDYADCKDTSDIVDGVKLLDELAAKYSTVTRITTRISAEEMTFDPAFEADFTAGSTGRLTILASQPSLASCESNVIDKADLAKIAADQGCAAMYCGAGTCAMTENGPGCACNAGFVAQRFIDLDGLASVTCVPQTPPVDLRAGGDVLPDACASTSCNKGLCMDRNGVAVCACNTDAAATVNTTFADSPRCETVLSSTETPGAQDYSEALRDLDVCAPAPPSCGEEGWLVKKDSPRPGVACGAPPPSPTDLVPKLGRTCGGCGGCSTDDESPLGALVGAWVVLGLLVVRRRRR
jgi:MYXO-CTERM domain-containing protein